jgi:hypothetical protein
MAQSSWPDPAASRVVTDLQYEQLVAAQYVDGVVGNPGEAPVVSADGSGMLVTVATGRLAQVRGHGWASGSPAFTLSVGSNTSGSTRIDLVVLGLSRTTWEVTAYVKAGTPGAGVAPALQTDTGSTGVYEIPLAEVTVLSGAASIAADKVKARQWWIRPDGVASSGAAARPPSPWPGARMWEAGTSYVWTGTAWERTSNPPTPVQVNQLHDLAGLTGSSGIGDDGHWHDFSSGTFPALTFAVPATGRVYLTVSGWLQQRLTTADTIWLSYRAVGGGLTAGMVDTELNRRGLSAQDGRTVSSKRILYTGLVPAATVTLTPVYWCSHASADPEITSIRLGNITMEPA